MTEKDNRIAANKAVREWKVKHKEEYDDFKRQIAAIDKGDLSLMERMMTLLNDCMPQDARSFYAYIFKYIGDPDSVKNDQAAFSRYDQLAAECIFNHALISMNFATGRIEQTDSMKQDCTIIRTDDFEQSVLAMPLSMKCILNDLCTNLIADRLNGQLTVEEQEALQGIGLLVAKTVYVYSLLFVPEYLDRLYKRTIIDSDALAYCIYFFVTFDHGLSQMADLFSHQMVGNHSSSFTSEMFRLCIRSFVSHSLTNRSETKESWEALANNTSNDDLWKEVRLALRDSHTHGGQQKDSRTLDELLICDTEVLKSKIQDYLRENPQTSRLAYLLYALRQTGKIQPCSYITFHRALQSLSPKPLGGPDVPQKRFHELMADPKLLDSKGKKWQQAKSIIDHWQAEFDKKDI
jgi:hypothetical protein